MWTVFPSSDYYGRSAIRPPERKRIHAGTNDAFRANLRGWATMPTVYSTELLRFLYRYSIIFA